MSVYVIMGSATFGVCSARAGCASAMSMLCWARLGSVYVQFVSAACLVYVVWARFGSVLFVLAAEVGLGLCSARFGYITCMLGFCYSGRCQVWSMFGSFLLHFGSV